MIFVKEGTVNNHELEGAGGVRFGVLVVAVIKGSIHGFSQSIEFDVLLVVDSVVVAVVVVVGVVVLVEVVVGG